jgi:putative transposase
MVTTGELVIWCVHAYVLMTNYVNLLMTPSRTDSISRAMQSIGRRYLQFVIRKYGRTSTLWEDRHKSSLIDQDRYLLACMRYIELNPVRTNMVATPSQFLWSSYRRNALKLSNRLIRSYELYESPGVDEENRARIYRSLFDKDFAEPDIELIRRSALFSMPTGDRRFREQIEKEVGRKSGYSKRGEPFSRTNRKCK